MLLCCVCFLLDNVFHLPWMPKLYLYNYSSSNFAWWQFISHQFCHGNLQHISSNLFQLCVFGRFVEETEGVFGVVAIYLLTGLGTWHRKPPPLPHERE
jgi:membrane associated rhomboid family serine protease